MTHKNDVVLIAVLLILSGGLALFLFATRQDGGIVRVQVDGAVVMELPLDQDTQVSLGEDGHVNTLVVRDGTAQIADATCPDQVCVRQGAVRYAGESIVCLPHRLIVTIEGGAASDIDGSTG